MEGVGKGGVRYEGYGRALQRAMIKPPSQRQSQRSRSAV